MTGSARSAPAAVTAGPATPSLSCPTTPYGVTETLATYGSPANGQALDLDEYQPVGDPQAHVPGVILVHGGGWAEGNFTTKAGDSLTTIGDCLAENGFDAFSVDYALSVGGNGSFPENLQDINEAIGWVKTHVSNLNKAQMFILGTSAGGNLAALAGENAMGYQDGLLGVITQSGPADLTAAGMGCASAANCMAGSPGATIEKYLGCLDNSSATCTLYFQDGTTQTVPAATAYADASPTASLSATVPAPPYLVANSSDEAIPLAQATDLTQQLNAQCTATKAATSDQLVVLPGDQHALTYSDILAGPALGFLNAVLAGSLPKNCATATPLTGASMAYDANASAKDRDPVRRMLHRRGQGVRYDAELQHHDRRLDPGEDHRLGTGGQGSALPSATTPPAATWCCSAASTCPAARRSPSRSTTPGNCRIRRPPTPAPGPRSAVPAACPPAPAPRRRATAGRRTRRRATRAWCSSAARTC